MSIKQIYQKLLNSGFITEQLIITCFCIKHELNVNLNQDHVVWLSLNGFLTRVNNKLCLTTGFYDNENIEQFETPVITDEEVQEFRSLFKGIRVGSMGSKDAVKSNLINFLVMYPNYSFKDIVLKTELHLNTQDIKFIPNADNFILKIKDGKQTSRLALVMEEETNNTIFNIIN